ncbi:MAG TPA: hypothetical protein VF950_00270 [Planctomycetota bacterium]
MFVLLLALASAQDDRPLKADDRLAFAVWRPDVDVLRDLREMRRAGVDVALAAAPPADLAASLEKAGDDRPLLAPYLDGEAPVDALRHFLERVPPRFRAQLDGRLVAFLGPAPESGRGVPLDGLKAAGVPLHLVVESTWTDAPGAARWTSGRPEDGAAVWVGGADYDKAWYAALKLEARWAVIESWDRTRAESTAKHVRKLRVQEKTALPKGKWTGAGKALFSAKYTPHEQGLRPLSTDEGACELVQLRGVAMLASKEAKKSPRRALTFDVDDSFCYFEKRSFTLTLEFLDLGQGAFRVEYDAADRRLPPAERHVRSAGETPFTGTGEWREVSIDLPDALFGNGQPGGGDFRLVLEGRGIAVRRVALQPR